MTPLPQWTVIYEMAVQCEQLVPFTSIMTEMIFMIDRADGIISRPGANYDLPKNWIIA
jgi:hypothetical protein